MPLLPLDIESRRFKRSPLGYHREEVHSFLRVVADALSRANLEKEELARMLQSARAEVDEFRAREKTLIDALATSERLSEERIATAHQDAERIISESRLQAEQILGRTRAEVTRVEQQILRLKVEREMFENRLSSLLDEHRRLLDIRRQEAVAGESFRARTTLPPTPEHG